MNCIICNSKKATIYKCYECDCYLFCMNCFNTSGSSEDAVKIRKNDLIPHENQCHKSVDIA